MQTRTKCLDTDKMTEGDLRELSYELARWTNNNGITANFRTCIIFTCTICKSRTNLAKVNGFEVISVSCPNVHEKWHQVLVEKSERFRGSGHPSFYKKELKKEIEAIKKKHPSITNV